MDAIQTNCRRAWSRRSQQQVRTPLEIALCQVHYFERMDLSMNLKAHTCPGAVQNQDVVKHQLQGAQIDKRQRNIIGAAFFFSWTILVLVYLLTENKLSLWEKRLHFQGHTNTSSGQGAALWTFKSQKKLFWEDLLVPLRPSWDFDSATACIRHKRYTTCEGLNSVWQSPCLPFHKYIQSQTSAFHRYLELMPPTVEDPVQAPLRRTLWKASNRSRDHGSCQPVRCMCCIPSSLSLG